MAITVDIQICKKDTLVSTLTQILQNPDYCGNQKINTRLISNLISVFIDTIVFVIEYPYVDKHYRDSYYTYHSAKLEHLGRDCLRVHLFESEISREQFFSNTFSDKLKETYLGFFIIRPLVRFPMGRSIISPKALNKQNFVCCLTQINVSLCGQKLQAMGFPHTAQDTETHSCAESSLWSMLEYYGTKYPHYKPLLPSEILHSLSSIMSHRQMPSQGLTVQELANGLNANGHPCLMYADLNPSTNELNDKDLMLLSIYIESGIPVIIALQNNSAGHAVIAIGHDEMDYDVIRGETSQKTWIDVSMFRHSLVLIDDNLPPYSIADIHNPASNYSDSSFKDMKITSFIVPLQRHMHLDAAHCYDLVSDILNNSQVGLELFSSEWITRLFLTGGHSFKEFILQESGLSDRLKSYLLHIALPKFIWCCEIYEKTAYNEDSVSGLILIDATGGNSLASVLLYWLKEASFYHDGFAWVKREPIINFKMKALRHNLKGVWNKWHNS